MENPGMYNDPLGGAPSTVGSQIRTDYFYKKALIEAAKEQYFGQMANVRSMPKNMGKKIKQYHYLPILDDRNINDQGIDALGISKSADFIADKTVSKYTVMVQAPDADGGLKFYFAGTASGADNATAAALAQSIAENKAFSYLSQVMNQAGADYATWAATAVTAPTVRDETKWYIVEYPAAVGDGNVNYGNLYGSSKDVGAIASKIPALSETGGRVNRVGMKRIELEGGIEKFGFFDEYTQESLDFDSDAELLMHITTESVKAANEITEDQLQIDLLHAAGVVRYTGSATGMATISGELDTVATSPNFNGARDMISYDDLVKLSIELTNNRTPKNTKIITGSRMIDTRVVNGAFYMYVGSELLPSLMRLKDYHGERAYLPVAQYGAAATIARGEVGAVHDFRIIVVPEMMHWEGAGADVADPSAATVLGMVGAKADGSGFAYNVYPMLVVGDASFTTIGFQTDGKTVKFVITHKGPGKETADRNDPYGEVGFYSIKWYYGFMALRSERIALVKTVASL